MMEDEPKEFATVGDFLESCWNGWLPAIIGGREVLPVDYHNAIMTQRNFRRSMAMAKMRADGHTYKEIGDAFGVSKDTARDILRINMKRAARESLLLTRPIRR